MINNLSVLLNQFLLHVNNFKKKLKNPTTKTQYYELCFKNLYSLSNLLVAVQPTDGFWLTITKNLTHFITWQKEFIYTFGANPDNVSYEKCYNDNNPFVFFQSQSADRCQEIESMTSQRDFFYMTNQNNNWEFKGALPMFDKTTLNNSVGVPYCYYIPYGTTPLPIQNI